MVFLTLLVGQRHFLKVLTFTKDLTDNTECNKCHCQVSSQSQIVAAQNCVTQSPVGVESDRANDSMS